MSDSTPILVLSNIALVFWSFQLAPQAYENYKNRSSGVLSLTTMLVWTLWTSFFGAISLVNELPLPSIIQPQLFGLFSAICFAQCIVYPSESEKGTKESQSVLFNRLGWVFALTLIVTGGLEVGLYYLVLHTPPQMNQTVAIIAGVLITIGFVPQFYDIAVTKSTVGLSRWFILLDLIGALFSTLVLVLRPPPFDAFAAVSYISVFVMDILLMICTVVYPNGGSLSPTDT